MRFASAAVAVALLQVAAAHQLQEPNVEHQRRNAAMLSQSCSAKDMTHLMGQNTCLLDPETIDGPYVYPTAPIRYDIREDTEGIPFQFHIKVVNATTCEPIKDVGVEVWHADHRGYYSHFIEQSQGNSGAPTDDTTFLRGVQFTNQFGVASFLSVFPGHYLDRSWHIHVRTHFGIEVAEDGSGYTGGIVSHVGQMYIADEVSNPLAQVFPYSENATPITPLAVDTFFQISNGTALMYAQEMCRDQGFEAGVVGSVTLSVLDTEASPWTPPPDFFFPGYITETEAGATIPDIRNTLPPRAGPRNGNRPPFFTGAPSHRAEFCQ